MKKGKGISFYWAIGAWGGFKFKANFLGIRLVLGYLALHLCLYDVDWIIGAMARRIEFSKGIKSV